MFARACAEIRDAIYATTITSHNVAALQRKWGVCTSFMIAPGILVTAAHMFKEHTLSTMKVEVVSASSLKRNGTFEPVQLIQSDKVKDIALLQISAPKSNFCVSLEPQPILVGTSCGALGFPHPKVSEMKEGGLHFNLAERFQGASVAAHYSGVSESGQSFQVYDTDSLMYGGSSGCPGFLKDGRVFGMHLKSWIDDINPGFSLWLSAEEIINFAEVNNVKL